MRTAIQVSVWLDQPDWCYTFSHTVGGYMLMRSSDPGPERLRFGLFEVDLAKAELRKQGGRLHFRISPSVF